MAMYLYDIKVRNTNDRNIMSREHIIDVLYKKDKHFEKIGNSAGIYMMYNVFGEILYIGQTKNFYNRMRKHHKFSDRGLMAELNKIRLFILEGEIKEQRELDDLEKALICKEQPRFNETAKGCYEIHYIAKYASEMLELADYEIGTHAIRWTGLQGIHNLHLQYREVTWDIQDMYTNWCSIGVPNMRKLRHLVHNGMTMEELSKIYGVPVDHIRRKVYSDKYKELLKNYYKGTILMGGWM